VEVTVNNKDWSNDGKTYGYFDPFVLRAEPSLISVDGTTKVRIKGFGFVNSTTSKSLISSSYSNTLTCQGHNCIKDAVYIDKNTLETTTFPQALVNYKETDLNVLWDPMNIDASIYGGSNVNDFTDNSVQVFYYEEPDYGQITADESPANIQTQIFIMTDFKKNPIDRLKKYSSIVCRFKGEDSILTQGEMLRYPLEMGQPNAISCLTPIWNLKGKIYEVTKLDIALNGQDFKGSIDFIFSSDLKIHRTVPMAGSTEG
jgi:hypothetical protein